MIAADEATGIFRDPHMTHTVRAHSNRDIKLANDIDLRSKVRPYVERRTPQLDILLCTRHKNRGFYVCPSIGAVKTRCGKI
jgi:hypothetical protein